MTIAILGAGKMGTRIAARLAAAGEDVTLAARDLKRTAEAAKSIGPQVKAATPAAAVEGADVVIVAVPYAQIPAALKEAGDLSGKVLIDISNAVGPNLSQAVSGATSAAEEIQRLVPGAKVVKAFNTIFSDLFEGPPEKSPPQVYYAGDDAAAKAKTAEVIRKAGFEPVDAGPLENARQIEAMGNLNIKFAFGLGRNRRIAFQIVQH